MVEISETKAALAEAIRKLPDKEKLVIFLYYYDGLTLKEIGEVMGLSESRISQLHTKAILRLRGRLSRRKSAII
jgi:RNA polymerase sigma factor for flagellar operon FliA